ncbi:hypothetical protein BDV3_002274 [Batrachochytrium dendrobatidis]
MIASYLLVYNCTKYKDIFIKQNQEMSGLPRQVIKWLQSLDLSFPIRIPKRDFANGYLIAEIFSRYYPNELQVWLLYTGDSTPQKANNWDVIGKFFKRNNINIPKEAMEAVMHCHADAAIRFVENLYMLLTKNSLPERSIIQDQEEIVPHFALPTSANAIRCMAESPDKARIVLEAHKEFIKQLRVQRGPEIQEIIKKSRHATMDRNKADCKQIIKTSKKVYS